METNKIYQGDCLQKLKDLPNESVDSIVTDPPYELGFMGKSWDNTGIANNKEMWKECLRVLKPGGHLLAFSGTRTYHRMASAIEDAGFEIRDMIEWVYGSGFPKSLNIGKAVDKLQGNERESFVRTDGKGTDSGSGCYNMNSGTDTMKKEFVDTKGTSEWEGWGTALKPAHEPICMARKPLAEKTVAENVLKYGTGGINIDESRVGTDLIPCSNDIRSLQKWKELDGRKHKELVNPEPTFNQGRFPANLIHDGSEEVLKEFEKAGNCGAFAPVKSGQKGFGGVIYGKYETGGDDGKTFYKDGLGTPARFFKQCEFTEEDFEYSPFFYCAKASKSERNKGMDNLEAKPMYKADGSGQSLEIFGSTDGGRENRKNNHPTVKPLKLMEYLIKMVTPKGGIVLDPFAGSGTTLVASKKLGYKYIGIELSEEYCKIANERLTKLNNGNDGIPPKPKELGILPTII